MGIGRGKNGIRTRSETIVLWSGNDQQIVLEDLLIISGQVKVFRVATRSLY